MAAEKVALLAALALAACAPTRALCPREGGAQWYEVATRHFTIDRCFPTSYNWHGGQPAKALLKAANMNVKANIPLIGPKLAVEYFFICSRR